jgi:hypothetical protein
MGLINRLKNTLLKIDLVGSKIDLYHNGSTKSHTAIGSILTTGILIFFLYCVIYFGLDIVYKEQPISRFSKEYVNVSRIYLKDYPLKILFTQPGIILGDISRFINFKATYLKIGLNGVNSISYDSLIVEHCKDEFIKPELKEFFYYQGDEYFKNGFCINPFKYIAMNGTTVNEDIFFQNPFGSTNSATFIIDMYPCVNSTLNNNTCYSTEVQNTLASALTLNIVHLDSYVNLNDHTEPFRYFMGALTTYLTLSTKKAHTLSVLQAIITTDDGFIMEDMSNSTHYQVESIKTDIADNLYYYRLILASTNLKDNYFRNYIKVQDIIAKIGGLFQFLLTVATYLLESVSIKSMRFELINSIYRATDGIIDESTKKSYAISSGITIINNPVQKISKPPCDIKTSVLDYYQSLFGCGSRYTINSYRTLLKNIESKFEVSRIVQNSLSVEYLANSLLNDPQKSALLRKPVIDLNTGEKIYEVKDGGGKSLTGLDSVNLIKFERLNKKLNS